MRRRRWGVADVAAVVVAGVEEDAVLRLCEQVLDDQRREVHSELCVHTTPMAVSVGGGHAWKPC